MNKEPHQTSRMDKLIWRISFITNEITRICFLDKGLKDVSMLKGQNLIYSNLPFMVVFKEPQQRG